LSRTLKGIIEKTMTAGHEMSGDDADIILVSTIQTDPASVELAKKKKLNKKDLHLHMKISLQFTDVMPELKHWELS
jgi:hypothetical protein